VNPGGSLEFTLKSNSIELLDSFIERSLPDALQSNSGANLLPGLF
jgi:hypothetical protein